MNLKNLAYLSYLIFEGEKSSREISISLDVPLYAVSRAMSSLSEFHLVFHPENRRRSWKVETSNTLNTLLEQLLLISKNSDGIKLLLFDQSVVHVAVTLHEAGNGLSIKQATIDANVSRVTATMALNKMTEAGLLTVQGEKPKSYYINRGLLARLFIETCLEINRTFEKQEPSVSSPESVISQIQANDAVLMLIVYGSYARKTTDNLSDIDLFIVTRDKFDRGEILSKYARKQMDLNVYSKAGFLQLLKTQPDFVSNLASANIVKGKELLEAMLL